MVAHGWYGPPGGVGTLLWVGGGRGVAFWCVLGGSGGVGVVLHVFQRVVVVHESLPELHARYVQHLAQCYNYSLILSFRDV